MRPKDAKDSKSGAAGNELVLADFTSEASVCRLQLNDHFYLERAMRKALETRLSGSTVDWCNPDTGNSGHVTPFSGVTSADGRHYCDFEQSVTSHGRTHSVYGRAYRNADGSWKLADTSASSR